MTKVAINGFGRIGRLVARLLIEKAGSGNGLRLRAIVVRQGGVPRDAVTGQVVMDFSLVPDREGQVKVLDAEPPRPAPTAASGALADPHLALAAELEGSDRPAARAAYRAALRADPGSLQAGGPEVEGEGGDHQRKPGELEDEEELPDELLAIGVGAPHRRDQRLEGEDHHHPHLLEDVLHGQKPAG